MSKNTSRSYQWVKIDHDKCSKCNQCIRYCPRDVLRAGDDGFPYMKYRDDCWYCDVCTYICPANAVHLEEVPYLIK